jgi:chromosome segregation ATPase
MDMQIDNDILIAVATAGVSVLGSYYALKEKVSKVDVLEQEFKDFKQKIEAVEQDYVQVKTELIKELESIADTLSTKLSNTELDKYATKEECSHYVRKDELQSLLDPTNIKISYIEESIHDIKDSIRDIQQLLIKGEQNVLNSNISKHS